MGGQNISVHLDKNNYWPGEHVSGKLVVRTEKPMQVDGITVKVVGRAEVRWNETERVRGRIRSGNNSATSSTRTITYHSKENYFAFKYNLMGSGVIGPGEYTYPFSSQLPANLPSSFSCPYGEIKYGVKGKIIKSVNQKSWAEFFVEAPLDLNYEPNAMTETKGIAEKNFNCCCCKSGPLSICVRVNQRGFVPGQVISPFLEVDNASRINIEDVTCSIKQAVWCKSHTPRHKERFWSKELVESSVGGLGRGMSNAWRPSLLLPLQSVSNIRLCSIISLNHVLEVRCRVKGLHTDLTVEVPLVLGTEPVRPAPAWDPEPPTAAPSAPPGYDNPPPYPWQDQPDPQTKAPI